MNLLLVLQIIISVALVGSILLQSPQGGFGRSFSGFSHYHTKRGFERLLFFSTIILGVAYAVVALLDTLV